MTKLKFEFDKEEFLGYLEENFEKVVKKVSAPLANWGIYLWVDVDEDSEVEEKPANLRFEDIFKFGK